MALPASSRERLLAAAMLAAAFVYLVPFVPRGWIPHDEGMLGQSAEYVLRGGLPHVAYEEAYTGGLSWLYAAAFRIAGVDLLNLRWLLFVAACGSAWLVYAVLRRFLPPPAAALGAWVAIVWSFPNYFAGLPSWWLLVCALLCVWAMVRHAETDRWPFLVLAGVAAGLAVAIKQTGSYLVIALVLAVLYDGGRARPRSSDRVVWVERAVRWGAAAAALAFATLILAPRLVAAEGIYLWCPAAACALVLFTPAERSSDAPPRAQIWRLLAALAGAAAPMIVLLLPYVRHGHVADFVNGWIVLPQKRLASASAPMQGGWTILSGLPLVAVITRAPALRAGGTIVKVAAWAAAIVLPIAALWHTASYQAIWQSARAFAALAPLAVCWRLASGAVARAEHRAVLHASAAALAWTSINQFPFAAPIYFSYVTPLAVIAAVAAARTSAAAPRWTLLPWGVMLLSFAILSTNRTYVESLGVKHEPRRFDAKLNLPRAHLRVGGGDAFVYRGLVAGILSHLQVGPLVAGPDCPEVYFLTGLPNPTGRLFDFFSDRADPDNPAPWNRGNTIVINHVPEFSPAPSELLVERLRRLFPQGQEFGKFELRWR